MNASELAALYLTQLQAHRDGVPWDPAQPNALYVWEDLICNDPERAWPVFRELLSRVSDDETLEQIWYRLRLLLYRHYASFHTRAASLLEGYARFGLIAGRRALDPTIYAERQFDRDSLISAYRALHVNHHSRFEVDRLAATDPERALAIATEIIHRGIARGWETIDVMDPLQDVLVKSGRRIVDRVEQVAMKSVAVRRVLWRLKRQISRPIDEDVRDRLERAAGTTTDFTELDAVTPPPEPQLDADEQLIAAWFAYEENFWAFSEVHDLCKENPLLAWSITLDLLACATDESEVGAIAAGPLEDLIRRHSDAIWPDLSLKAHTDQRLATALRGVWVFESDGDVFHRFKQLMDDIESVPN